jgi:hypothetical protein
MLLEVCGFCKVSCWKFEMTVLGSGSSWSGDVWCELEGDELEVVGISEGVNKGDLKGEMGVKWSLRGGESSSSCCSSVVTGSNKELSSSLSAPS